MLSLSLLTGQLSDRVTAAFSLSLSCSRSLQIEMCVCVCVCMCVYVCVYVCVCVCVCVCGQVLLTSDENNGHFTRRPISPFTRIHVGDLKILLGHTDAT